jgi:Tol biopolymer transport system component/DNA-binding winged helix-turn-helix (wHTH) protein
MSSSPYSAICYRFGAFELDLNAGDLRKNGVRLKIQEQPYQLLLKLLQQPGRVVTREELHSTLWPADTFVDFDTGLNTAVKRLREVLGDSADAPVFIETIPKRGYKFIAPVSGNGAEEHAAGSHSPGERTVSWPRLAALGTALLLAAAAGALAVWIRSPLPAPRIIGSFQITSDGFAKANLHTDGKQLYFNERLADRYALLRVPAAGGQTSTLDASMPGMFLADLSPDGTKLLLFAPALNPTFNDDAAPLEVMNLPSASLKILTGIGARDASWAPSGQVVFTKDLDIYVANDDGTQQRKLLTASGFPFFVRYSPDGRRIRFSVADKFTSSFSLWEARSDGTGLRELLPGWNDPPQECCGLWTPDGRYFVFVSQREGSRKIWALPDSPSFWPGRSAAPVQLTTEPLNFFEAVPSRDGKQLFVLGAQPRAELVRYDAKSAAFVPFLAGISAGDVEVSPDAKSLIYVKYPEGTLWRSKVDGGSPSELTDPSLQIGLAHWSPDGERIAFAATRPGRPWNLFLISSGGGALEQITSGPIADLDPTWSPDGKTLAFGQLRAVGNSQRYSIQMLDLASRRQSQLAGSDGICCPRWSPDGRYLVTSTQRSDELMLYEFASQKWITAAKILGSIGYMAWSRDSKYVSFDTLDAKEPVFYRLRVADGHLERVVSLKDIPRFWGPWGPWTGLAPDGSPLLVRDISNQEVYALNWQLP